MKQFICQHRKMLSAIAACLLIAGLTMSFQIPFGPMDKLDSLTELQDTIPGKDDEHGQMSMKEYDQLMLKMDNGIMKMQEEINNIDLEKMHQDIAASLSRVDFNKIQSDIDKAMKNIDFNKIEKGVKSALNGIEWNKLNDNVKISLQEAKREIEKVNMEELKKEMQKAKLEIERSRHQLEKINFKEITNNATNEIVRAKEELKLTKMMFNQMEKEGLISQKEGFKIEYKNKTLWINGKKQSEATRNKYQQYIKGDSFKITISKE